MRKLLLVGALVLAAIAPALPAQARHFGSHNLTLQAEVPCMVVCSYWIDQGFTACETPFPPGSYDDFITPAFPALPAGGVGLLSFEIFPLLDWDSFVCANTPGKEELGRGANVIGELCDGILGPSDPSSTGCKEEVAIVAQPGKSYVLRGYNWQDLPTCPARYTFSAA